MANEMSRRVGKMVLFGCVLSVGLAASAGAVELGERIGLLELTTLDGGRTWEKPLTLEPNPGEYSYPCIIQASDGRIHISYTFRRYAIKHIEMNENWLVHLKRPN